MFGTNAKDHDDENEKLFFTNEDEDDVDDLELNNSSNQSLNHDGVTEDEEKVDQDFIDYYDESYLDDLLNSFDEEMKTDEDNEAVDDEEDSNEIVFRDFPVEDGYVRIPIKFPGVNITKIPDVPQKLWTAEDAFKEQVIPSLYMFIPSALLGFIIGMVIWIIILIVQRTYTSIRKSFQSKNSNLPPEDDFISNMKNNLTEDPWKKISDAETVHAIDGTTLKGDRVWQMRQRELRPGIGGSDRKPARKLDHNLSTMSSISEGKRIRKVSIGLNLMNH